MACKEVLAGSVQALENMINECTYLGSVCLIGGIG